MFVEFHQSHQYLLNRKPHDEDTVKLTYFHDQITDIKKLKLKISNGFAILYTNTQPQRIQICNPFTNLVTYDLFTLQ